MKSFLLLLCFVFNFLSACAQEDYVIDTADMSTVTTSTAEEQTYRDIFDQPAAPGQPQLRTLPDSTMTKVKAEDQYWYHNYEPKPKKLPNQYTVKPERRSRWSIDDFIWYILGFLVLVIVVLLLRANNVNLLGTRNKKIRAEGSIDEADLQQIPFMSEIQKAERSKDYRLAVRLRYLELLKELELKQWIKYNQDLPNSAYVSQLSGKTFQREFRNITLLFDYTWYGQFPIEDDVYEKLRHEFIIAKNRLA